jgi:hypothetical protein
MYYDKSQAELDAFQIRLERSIQNQKLLESTIEEQNDNLKQTLANHDLLLSQVERLQKENMEAQNEVTDIRKKFSRHSLDVLSVRKPKLIENIINKGTKQVLNDLKTITNPYQFDEAKPITNTSAG